MEARAVAAHAEINKILKYSHLDSSYLFVYMALKTYISFGPKALEFLQEVGH